MTDTLDRNCIARLARSKVRQMPYIVSETNAPFPNDYAAGFLPILAAYGSFQDWDGLFPYNYNQLDEQDNMAEGVVAHFFATGADPVKMTEAVAAGLAFLRADVQPARQTIGRTITRRQMVSSQKTPVGDAPFWLPDLPGRLALMHAVEIADFAAAENLPRPAEFDFSRPDVLSDTGELRWQALDADGRVSIDTPAWQGMIGRQGKMETGQISLELTSPYASIQLISLDGLPIPQTARMLLVTAARVANSGMRWTDDRRSSLGEDFGGAPTRLEPVLGTLVLRGLEPAMRVEICPLDGSGQPAGQPQTFSPHPTGWQISLANLSASPWCLITVKR